MQVRCVGLSTHSSTPVTVFRTSKVLPNDYNKSKQFVRLFSLSTKSSQIAYRGIIQFGDFKRCDELSIPTQNEQENKYYLE